MIEDARALAVGRAVLALVDALGLGSMAARVAYDAQHLPPGVTRDAFLRRHRARVREGVAGWARSGQGRTVTRSAWEADVAEETARSRRRPVTHAPAANDDATSVERALGIRVHRGNR
jgi:hypothetical protein